MLDDTEMYTDRLDKSGITRRSQSKKLTRMRSELHTASFFCFHELWYITPYVTIF